MQGGCYCGALRYEINGRAVMKAQCHCRPCQYISGGGPNIFMVVPDSGFSLTKGTPKHFTRDDIDNPVTRAFCPTCGTHIATLLKDKAVTVVKVGTLDHPAEDFVGPKMAIYMQDTQPYLMVPEGFPCFDGLPPGA